MMIFICQKWWWSMAIWWRKTFTFEGCPRCSENETKWFHDVLRLLMSRIPWSTWKLTEFLGWKVPGKQGFFPPLNLCRKFPPPKKASFLGCHDSWFWFFVGHISSYPWLSLILIAPFPFMKLINSLRAAKQHAAPKESWELFKVKGWLRESLGIGKKW